VAKAGTVQEAMEATNGWYT